MKYIGIDGGGTKTKFVLYDENGQSLQEIIDESVHALTHDIQDCIDILKRNIEKLDKNNEAVIVAGLAGYGNQKDIRKKIENICQQAFGKRKYYLYNDVEIAAYGALNGQNGIVVIAGTGSIAYSYRNGETRRCGGWGYQIGDEGSAYWIGNQLISKYCQQADGRLEKTKLYELIKKECQLNEDYDIIQYRHLFKNERGEIAKLAKLNNILAKDGDPYAIDIYHEAAYHLSLLIRALAKEFDESFVVSYIGGVFQSDRFILQPLQDYISDLNCNLCAPIALPEYGAYLIGKTKIML